MIAEEAKSINDVDFVWITDGGGWTSARRNLEETFGVLEYMFNIADMENGILIELFNS
jgi:type II restriction enzyme